MAQHNEAQSPPVRQATPSNTLPVAGAAATATAAQRSKRRAGSTHPRGGSRTGSRAVPAAMEELRSSSATVGGRSASTLTVSTAVT